MAGGAGSATKVVQITNIAPQATKDQMQNLFGNVGKIDEIRLYPTIRDVSCPVFSRICYVKYLESSCVAVAQHLTNTVFIDRALIVCPVQSGNMPDEYKALEMTNNGTTVPGLHTPDSNLPPEVVNRIEGIHPNQFVTTSDPKLEEYNMPEYPKLPANYDARKIEEIRRTVIVHDVQPEWQLEDLMDHFSRAGEVKYARFAEKDGDKFAMIEYCEQKSVIVALKMQGTDYLGEELNIYHSTQAITKPEAKSNEAAQREIEEAMSIVKEAQNMISAAIDPVIGMLSKDNSSSSRRRSRSRSRRRSRSRSKRSSKSRSKRSKSHSKRSSSRSRSKRSRSRKRSKSKTKSRKSRSKSRKRSRSKSKRSSPTKRSKSRSKRSRSRSKRSRSKSTHSKRSRSKRSRSKRSRSRERRKRSRSRRKSLSRSPVSRRRSRSRSRGKRSRSRDRRHSRRKEERRHRTRSRSKSKRRSYSKSRSSRSKDSKSSKKRSRSSDSKKIKRISEEKVTRDYDAEEKIGLEEAFRPPEPIEKSTSPEKSDNMDISNSP